MFKTVLAPIDLNHEASWRNALPAAIAQVAPAGALHLMVVIPDFGMSIVGGFFPEGFEAAAHARIRTQLEAFAKANVSSSVRVATHVARGHVPEQILATAGAVGADLIVMGSHPPDDLRDMLVGSNSDKVVRHSPVSVLVVRNGP